MHELAKSLEHESGVREAHVEGLQVFANPQAEDEGKVEEELREQQDGWPGTVFKLLQMGQHRHRLKVRSLHSV